MSTFGRDHDHAQAVWDAGLAAIDQIETIVADESIACDWARVTGYKHAARDGDVTRAAEAGRLKEADVERLREEARLARDLGFSARFVDQVPVFGAPGVAYEAQGKLHPRKDLARLATLVHGDGATCSSGAPATKYCPTCRV